MNIKLILTIAKSLLLARWKQTLVAAVGVTFSITMFITLLGFMSGLNDLLDGLILNRTPHIKLFNEIKASKEQPIDLSDKFKGSYHFIHSIKPSNARQEIYNNGAILKTLKNDNRVKGIAPKIVAQVFYNVGAIDVTGVINGIDVEAENTLFFFKDYVTKGNYIDLMNVPNSIILGKGVADKMLANIGDVVQVTTPKGDRIQLKVVGFFQSGLQELDKVQSYASLATSQKLLGKSNNYITDIQIKLNDITNAPAIAKEFAKTLKEVIIHGTLTNIAATWVNGIDTFMGQKEFWWTKDGIPLATKQTRQASTANRCGLPLIPDGASDGFPASLPPEGGVIEKEYLTKSEKERIGPSLDHYEWDSQKKVWNLKKEKKGGKKKLSRKRRI
jgi:hypothetical protein